MSLTKHPEGSLRELWTLSVPLMLTSLSFMMMTFVDRWLLAHFSADAHNAAVAATTLGWALICGWIVLAGIAEVFVAQHNGAGQKHKLGGPVWQMVWLSIASSLFFIPAGLWGPQLVYGTGADSLLERDYLGIMLLFGPFNAMQAAIAGFFVGQGKTRLVTSVVVIANLVNMGLDYVLIFGIEGWVPSMGVKGAALATSTATIFQNLILGAIFLNQRNRKECGTSDWHIDLSVLWSCVKIGLPSAILIVGEIMAFAVYYMLMKQMGLSYITIAGICQSMFILCLFFSEGVNKAVTAIIGNMIGAGHFDKISLVFRAGFKLNLLFGAAVFTLYWLGTPLIAGQFLSLADPAFFDAIYSTLYNCLLMSAVLIFFEGLKLVFSGGLTAAGDTMFLFGAGSTLVWVLMLLPVYLFVVLGGGSMELAMFICICYASSTCLVYYFRTRMMNWKSGELGDLERKVEPA